VGSCVFQYALISVRHESPRMVHDGYDAFLNAVRGGNPDKQVNMIRQQRHPFDVESSFFGVFSYCLKEGRRDVLVKYVAASRSHKHDVIRQIKSRMQHAQIWLLEVNPSRDFDALLASCAVMFGLVVDVHLGSLPTCLTYTAYEVPTGPKRVLLEAACERCEAGVELA